MNDLFKELVYKLNDAQLKMLLDKFDDFAAQIVLESQSPNENKVLILDSLGKIRQSLIGIIDYNKRIAAATEAASKNETTIPKEDWGVHESHCCLYSGCKYANVDCPVYLGLVKQMYVCEFCEGDCEFSKNKLKK